MGVSLDGKLVVAISSRALFDFEAENHLFEKGDDRAYMRLQLEKLDEPAHPGVAFSLIRKLLSFNDAANQRVEVVMLSRNDPVSGLRVFRSVKDHDLQVQRGVFTRGRDPWRYLAPLKANLFLSANAADVRAALNMGFPAATVATHAARALNTYPNEVRIAFDGDAVLFSDEAERVYQQQGLAAFAASEKAAARQPLSGGPFKNFLLALHRLQAEFPPGTGPIRTALVTARSAPAHQRVVLTLRDWNIRIDESLFLGGLDKGEFLRAYGADVFFDDQQRHCESASEHVATGHVPHGIVNEG